MEKNSIIVNVDISYEIYRKFFIFFLSRKAPQAKFISILVLLPTVIALVSFFVFIVSGSMSLLESTVLMGQTLLFPVIFVALMMLPLISLRKKYENDKQMNHPQQYTIDNNGFELKGEGFQVYRTWEEIKKVSLTKKWCMFWLNNNFVNFFPIEKLNPVQIEELKAIIAQYPSIKKDF